LGHLKAEYTESLLLLRRHLGNWSRGPAVSMRSELPVALENLGQFSLLLRSCTVRNKFLSIFETASFFCVFPLYELSEVVQHCLIDVTYLSTE
jgi:hypothetical protein